MWSASNLENEESCSADKKLERDDTKLLQPQRSVNNQHPAGVVQAVLTISKVEALYVDPSEIHREHIQRNQRHHLFQDARLQKN